MKFSIYFCSKMDSTERILSFIDSIDTTSSRLSAVKPQVEPQTEDQTEDQTEVQKEKAEEIYNIDNIHENEKFYKSFRERLNKVKHYPQSVKVFGNDYITVNSAEDIEQLKSKITQNRRSFNKLAKSKQLMETKMNVKALPVIEEDESMYREDEYVYKRSHPIGVIDDDNKARRLPKTNKRDRMKIFEDLASNKDHLRELVNNREDFEDKTEQFLSDSNKAMYSQHRHNNITSDNTWTYETFVKIIDDIGKANEQREQQLKVLQQQSDPNYKYSQNGKAFHAYGLNPNLLKRK